MIEVENFKYQQNVVCDFDSLTYKERCLFVAFGESATTDSYIVSVIVESKKYIPTYYELECRFGMTIEEIRETISLLVQKGLIIFSEIQIVNECVLRPVISVNPLYFFNGHNPNKDLCDKFGICEYTTPYIESTKNRIVNKITNGTQLLEKDIEKYLASNLHIVEHGLKLIKRQYKVSKGFIDILALDENNVKCIIEIKKVDHDKSLVFQSVYYPTEFNEKVRMITITPGYTSRIKQSLKSLNYVEMKQYNFENGKLNIIDV
ncbi:endonuclease NucS domain-containing protein [Paenibacillus sp. JSM ZJ436]|uniref:endonuclease NucS domain-containing protein n=1 Tax=Paenibacillus sp. JSM ZJ436 TaxID=3376190 RepID=UPI0037A1B286